MAKTLDFTDTSPRTVKIGDTTTSFTLICGNNNMATDLTNATSITVKLGNSSGYLKSATVDPASLTDSTADQVTVTFTADLMNSLPAGSYTIEVWVVDSTGTSIYPSDGSTGFTIENNIQSTNGSTITTITFDDFVKAMNKAASTIKGEKGDTGPQGVKGDKGDDAVIADGSIGWKQRTPVGSQTQVQYFGTGKINFDFENKSIVIPKETNIVVGKNNIQIYNDITTAIPINDGTKFFILTVSLQGTSFNCYTNATIDGMSESETVVAVCNNAEQTVEMNGDYLINGRAHIDYVQPVITYNSNVIYKVNSDTTMLVTFVRNDKSQVIISYPSVQKRVPVEASYTLKSSEALVYNSIDNSLAVLNFDSLLPDSLIIFGNYHGNVNNNNINAVQGDGNYAYYLDGTENVIYYGGTVTAKKKDDEIDVNFDLSNPNLYYKDSAGNHQMTVAKSMYTVPHNFSLVLNRETKSLEVINTDNVIRGVHSILITCHHGFAKKVGMYFNSLKTDVIKLPDSGKNPINRYNTYVGQDATKVGDEYWLFDGSTPDHTSTTSIHRINPTDFSEIGLITHNLGHANGVDYRDNTLLVYNGSALPPEINLYKNPDNTMTDLETQDAANTQIIFKESSKLLPGDGSACFGLDNKIVYYAYSAGGTQVVILKILLGLGDNDLSDKTTDKSDNQHWGSFVSGKSNDEYNGTAQIISSYTGEISGDNQPQGMAFNGDLYLGTSHSEQKAYQLQLLDDGSFKVVDNYKSEMTDYKNNVIGLEPEITFIDPVKRSVFVGGRGSISNVAEFGL